MELLRATHADTTEGQPFDGADPTTPASQGWARQDPGAEPTEYWPHRANDIQGELVRLTRIGITPNEDRDQLRQIFYQGDIPPDTTLPMIFGVADYVSPADIVSQTGHYIRVGQWCDMHVAITWANTNALLDADQIRIPLPYESGRRSYAQVSTTQSTFQLDDPGPGVFQFYEGVIAGSGQTSVRIWRTNGLGSLPALVPIGDSVADGGNRTIWLHIRYRIRELTPGEIASGASERSGAWPLLEWYSLTHTPISPGPTVLEYRYDGAQNGDVVELWNGAVVDSAVITAPPQYGRGSFTIGAAGTYQVRIARLSGIFYSNTFTVDPS
jgi:hypothetical protein